MLLVSPERLNNPGFRDQVLPGLAGGRPGGGRRGALHLRLGPRLPARLPAAAHPAGRTCPPGVPVLATTATANARVTARRRRAARRRRRPETLVLRGAARPGQSLHLAVVLAAHRRSSGWPGWPSTWASCPGSGIIYTLTVAAAQEIAAFLREQGTAVAAYTGRDEPERAGPPRRTCSANRVKALVATTALGMGFDKPDLGFVVHLGAPPSPVAYYQQIGRAGRGVRPRRGDPAARPGGPRHLGLLRLAGVPARAQVRATLAALAEAGRPLSAAALETHVDLSRARLETMLKVLDVDGAVHRVSGGWRRPASRGTTTPNATRGSPPSAPASSRPCSTTWPPAAAGWSTCAVQLDDPAAAPCGRCDNCTGQRAGREVSRGGRGRGAGAAAPPRRRRSSRGGCGRPG